jgi:hypothetical protein
MTPEQRAAYINAKTAMMLVEMAAMSAANFDRMNRGNALAYDEEAFMKLPAKYGLDENTLTDNLFR